jgi:hypothetical protein
MASWVEEKEKLKLKMQISKLPFDKLRAGR